MTCAKIYAMTSKTKVLVVVAFFAVILLSTGAYLQKLQTGIQTDTTHQGESVVQSSPMPTATPPTSTKEHYNWKTYKNDKIGVSFEYPDYFEIEEQEFDQRAVPENYPQPPYPAYEAKYSFYVDFSSEDSRNLKPYPLDELSFIIDTEALYRFERMATFTKKIGNNNWKRYAPINCTNKPKDGKICTDIGGGSYMSYETKKDDFHYGFILQNESLENSPDFVHMLETMVISPPQLDTP